MAGKEYQIAVKIAGKVDKSLNNSIAKAQGMLGSIGGGIGSAIGKSVQIAGAAFGAIATGVVTAGAASVKVGSDFETAMSSLSATANANTEQYAALKAAAMECGRTTSKTASESSAALEYMALAGWSVEDSIAGLPSVLRLSEATAMDLAYASDLTTDSMAALGLTVDQLPEYLDVAAKANNKSNQSAQQLMEAYLAVGGTMKNLKVPIQESATALGVLANRGLKGSEGGTALNAIMVNLTTGAGKAGKAMKALGVSAFDSEGNFIGLEATLQQLNTALAGCTEEQRNAYLAAIGGKTHVDALNALMSGLNTEVSEGVSEWAALEEELYNADGALQAMRDTKLDNLAGDTATFKSALEDVGIHIYDGLQKPLREAVQFGTQEIYSLSSALEEGGISGLASQVGVVLSDVLQKAMEFGPQLLSIIFMIASGLLQGIRDNAPALAEGAAELASAFLQGFMEFYADFWTTAAILLDQLLQSIDAKMPEIMEAGRQMIIRLSEGITSHLPSILETAVSIILQLIEGLGTMLPELVSMAVAIIVQLANGITQAIPQLIPVIIQVVLAVVQTIIANLDQILEAALQLIMALAQGILDAIPVLIAALPELIQSIIDFILGAIPQIIETGIQLLTALVDALPEIIQAIVDAIPQIIDGIINAVLGAIPQIVDAGIRLLVALIQALPQIIATIVPAIPQIVTSIVGAFVDNIPAIVDAGIQLLTALIQNLPVIIAEIVKAIPQIIEGIVTALMNGLSAIVEVGANLVRGLWEGIQTLAGWLWDQVSSWISGIWDGICDFFGINSPSVEMAWVGKMLVRGLSNSITYNGREAVAAAQGMSEDVDAVMQQLGYDMSNALPTAFMFDADINRTASNTGGYSPYAAVAWNAQGAVLEGAQIFGTMGNNILGGGEAGHEAVLPLDTLWTEMRSIITDIVGGENQTGAIAALAEKLEAFIAGTSIGSRISDLIDRLNGDGRRPGPQPATEGGPGYAITYAPTFNFFGDKVDKDDVIEGASMTKEQFESFMDDYVKEHDRRDF